MKTPDKPQPDEPAEVQRFDRVDIRAEKEANKSRSNRARAHELRTGAAKLMRDEPPERLVATVDETARMLGTCRASLYPMMARGELPYVVIAGRRRIPMSAIRTLIGEGGLR